ncbi:hypothetical protein [Cohnella candidum]|nr:hypothetical protein [Cohnella candidum]
MSGEHPSAAQEEASSAQSKADRTGQGKERSSRMQSKADRAAYPKHGL